MKFIIYYFIDSKDRKSEKNKKMTTACGASCHSISLPFFCGSGAVGQNEDNTVTSSEKLEEEKNTGTPLASASSDSPNRTVSPSPSPEREESSTAKAPQPVELVLSFEEWQKQENDWDDVVVMMGVDDDDHDVSNMNDILSNIETEEDTYRIFLESPLPSSSCNQDSANGNAGESIVDEFLVGQASDYIEIEVEYDAACNKWPDPPGAPTKLNKKKDIKECSAVIKKEISATNKSMVATKNVIQKELYKTRLTNLKQSMKRSMESRHSLRMGSSETEKNARQKIISQVLRSVEYSSRQIGGAYLDPMYLHEQTRQPPTKPMKDGDRSNKKW